MDDKKQTRQNEDDLETREVKVEDPHLTEDTNERLTEEIQEVVGARKVRVPRSREHPSHGEQLRNSPAWSLATSNWLVVTIGVFAAVVVAGIAVSSVTGSWWFAGLAIVLDIIGLALVALVVIRMMKINERPDPTLVAAMEAEGIVNPEQYFTDIVEEFTETDPTEGGDRTVQARENPTLAAAEQRSASTPTSGKSRAVGP